MHVGMYKRVFSVEGLFFTGRIMWVLKVYKSNQLEFKHIATSPAKCYPQINTMIYSPIQLIGTKYWKWSKKIDVHRQGSPIKKEESSK